MIRTYSFPKYFRLRSSTEFQSVYKRGAKKTSRSFVVFTVANGLEHSRFGLTTPRKLGPAHDRNRIRRRVREIIRTSRSALPAGLDIVLNPRRSAIDRELGELQAELLSLFGPSI